MDGPHRSRSNWTEFYVQKMEPGGVELLISAFRDPSFGVIVSIGAGGVMTELIDDVTLARPYPK